MRAVTLKKSGALVAALSIALLSAATVALASDDAAAPTTSSDVVASYSGPARITLTATDGSSGSGVATITYSLDGGAATTVTPAPAPTVVAPSGVPPITPTVQAPAGHMASGTVAGGGGCGCHHEVAAAPTIASTAAQPKAHSDMTCTSCHAVTGGWTDSTGVSGVQFVVGASGAHTLTFWSADKAGNTEGQHAVSFTIGKTATKLTLAASRSSVARGRTVVFSGKVSPARSKGVRVVLQKRKSTARAWSNVTARTTANSKWTYTYRATSKGTYYFRVTCAGDSTSAASTSSTKKLTVK